MRNAHTRNAFEIYKIDLLCAEPTREQKFYV